jgi:hypothetical protein
MRRRNVDSTDDVGHGNLPCACDGPSGDCTVVRDESDGPKAHPRLQPEGKRASAAARGGGRPPAPSQPGETNPTRRFARYKGFRGEAASCRLHFLRRPIKVDGGARVAPPCSRGAAEDGEAHEKQRPGRRFRRCSSGKLYIPVSGSHTSKAIGVPCLLKN